MISLIQDRLLEKKHQLETEVRTIGNSLENLEKANIIYGVEIFSKGFEQDIKVENKEFKVALKECTEKFMTVNDANEINETTLCWAYVDGVYVYLEAGVYGEVVQKLGMEEN